MTEPRRKAEMLLIPDARITPSNHKRNKWYFQPYPMPVGYSAGEAFATNLDAEWAARGCDPNLD